MNDNFWEAATIEWPSAQVKLVQGIGSGYRIAPDPGIVVGTIGIAMCPCGPGQ